MALRPNYSLVGQGLRLGFVVFIVVHVLISAWLVIDFEGEYTDGAPAPTRIDAIAVIDDEETLIDVKMERSTSFILYMLYRDYDSSYGVNETADEDNSTVVPSEQQNDDKGNSSSSNDSDTDWLKIGRNTTFAFMILLVASEILMFFTLKFRSAIRFFCWFGLILCFTVVMPTTYVIDLVGADEKEDDDKSYEESLSEENFVDSTESGSMAHEEYSFESKLIAFGVKFNMGYSGYDLGLVEPEDYETLRQEIPVNNSTLEDSFVAFDSSLELKYGKNLPSLLLIPIAWYILPAKPRKPNVVIRDVDDDDILMMLEINEQGLPGTGKVDIEQLSKLRQISEFTIGAYENGKMIGFVICLLPKQDYGSLNYAWFNERYDDFIYVDRIAVEQSRRNHQVGTKLYSRVKQYAEAANIPVAAEVSLMPPNEGSDRFHLRNGFTEVGKFHTEDKSVTMYLTATKPMKEE